MGSEGEGEKEGTNFYACCFDTHMQVHVHCIHASTHVLTHTHTHTIPSGYGSAPLSLLPLYVASLSLSCSKSRQSDSMYYM